MRRTLTALTVALTLSGCALAPDVSRETSPTPSAPPTASPSSSPTPEETTAPPTQELYPVTRVVDGDTFYATVDGESVGVRIIGMDTPETVHPTVGVECYGPEASAAAKARLTGQSVALIQDPTQGTLQANGLRTDYYGRALFYVQLADGTDYGLEMIQDGLATSYRYNRDYDRQDQYRAAEDQAISADTGLWGACPDQEPQRRR